MRLDTYTQFEWNLKAIDLAGFIISLRNFLFHHDMYEIVKRNSQLVKKSNANKKCYVCGLGPSFKDVNMNKIVGDTFVVNRFFKIGKEHPDFVPTYYVMVDNLFANDENIEDFQEALDTYKDKETIFILSSKLRHVSFIKEYDPSKIFYVSCFKGGFRGDGDYRIDRVLPAIGNVVSNAIVFSILMGYKEITLLGCDFNSFASTSRNHCYSEKESKRLYSLSYELFCYAFMAKRHEYIQKFAIRQGAHVINSTKGSLIDAYPFIVDKSLYNE